MPARADTGQSTRLSARGAGRAPFDEGREAFRAGLRRFVAREITPRVPAWERAGTFPRAAVRACGSRGYLALDAQRAAIFAEEIARCDSLGVALSAFVQGGLIAPLLERLGATPEQREYLARVRAGRLVGALAVTEEQAGSDISGQLATAVIRRPKAKSASASLVLTAEKTYITCAAAADFLIVAAKLCDGDRVDADISLVVVPTNARGARVRALNPLGLQASGMGHVSLRNCVVPMTALLGERGAGYGYVLDALDRERLFGGIGAVAWAQRAIEKTAAFIRERRAFGRPVSRHQAVRHQLAECAAALEAARQLNYAAFARWAAGEPAVRDIAMVKLFSYREAQRVIELCLQLHGGKGYMGDHWTAQWYRDARALTIAAGTPEVMRELIAAHLRL